MPPYTRHTRRQSRSLAVQDAGLSIQSRGSTSASSTAIDRVLYDSDEDYDSDACGDMPLPQRVSSKLRSALHAAWVDLSDDDFYFPHDNDHNMETVEPTLQGLADFLVEVQEALVWWRESDSRYRGASHTDVETLWHIYHALAKDGRVIGMRAVLELKMVADTYVALYRGLDEHRLTLATSLLVRRVRMTSGVEERGTRMELTEQTTGDALLQRVECLKQSIDAALVQCGEQV